jgi:flagellar protein FliJ
VRPRARQIATRDQLDLANRFKQVYSTYQQKVQQLQSYRDDYLRNSQSAGAIDAVKLQNYRIFLDRLGEALRQQLKLLDAARAEYEKRRALWSEKRIEAESLGRAVDRFRKEERHAADQREQREGDDAALRVSLARGETGNH